MRTTVQYRQARRLPSRRSLQLESLESRWTPAWGGVPPSTIVPPTNPAAVTLNSASDAQGTATISLAEVDYYRFTAPVSGSYQLSVGTPNSNLDPVLGVFNANGQRLAYNDDIVPYENTDSRLSLNLVKGNRYYVGITNYTGSPGGAYSWNINGPAPLVGDDAREDNDTRATASDLGKFGGLRTVGGLVMNDAADWYQFTTNAVGNSGSSVSIAFNNANGDLDLQLFNAAGTRLATSDGESNAESISLSGRAGGTYYVRVVGYQGASNPQYSLSLNLPTTGVDLQGATLSAADSGVFGQTLAVQASVRNNGNVAAGAFAVEWWLSRDGVWSSDDMILTDLSGKGNRVIVGLAAGATSGVININLSLPPSLPAGWDASSVRLVMRTDAGNLVAEAKEGNNAGQMGLGRDRERLSLSTTPVSQFQISLNISGLTASQRAVFQTAADRWAEVIVGDLPNATYNGVTVDDVRIDARGVAIDGAGGVLGQAGPDALRSGSRLPIHGEMEFDTADLSQLQSEGLLLEVILHEMGHVLGFGTIWDNLGLLQGAGTSNPLFTGDRATAEYNRIFGTSAAGVPVENSGGPGTRDGHFRESIFNNELMTGYIDQGVNPLSRVTVAAMADMGYRVNLAAADSFTRPAGVSVAESLAASAATPAVVAAAPAQPAPQQRSVAWEAALQAVIDEPAATSRRSFLAR